MKARFEKLDVKLSGRALTLGGEVVNRGAQAWDSAAALGYQIYDAESETLLVDGERRPIGRAIPAAGRIPLDLEIELPSEPGRYRLFVSPYSDRDGWAYAHGSPFLLVEAEVGTSGAARLLRAGPSSLGALGLRRLARSARRALIYPARTVWTHRSLIRSMVRRDIAGRYVGSFGGAFWTIIHPLLMMATYWFVFGLVLRTRFGEHGTSADFLFYFLAGMLPWLAFSEAAGRAPSVVVEHANFVKKLVFPVEILPVNLVAAGLISEFFGLLIFLAGLLVSGRSLGPEALLLPLLLVPQVLFTAGLSWFLAALGVLFRDLGQIIGFVLTVWMFTTPIFYPEASLPQDYLWLFDKNPIFILVRAYRDILLEGRAPDWSSLAVLTAASAVVCTAGYAWFYKLRKQFADIL